MAQSMTGFGCSERAGCRVEIRSLNQRFLDISIKSPTFLNQHEMTFRNILRERFDRGKFDVNISVSGESAASLKVNNKIAEGVLDSLRSLQKDFGVGGEVDITCMAYFHDMFMETEFRYDIEEVVQVFHDAVNGLYSMRKREGEMLVDELKDRIDALQRMQGAMKELSAKTAVDAGKRLMERIIPLLDNKDLDPTRMHQEVALLAGKSDISEEIARLGCHIRQFREILESGDIIGRKLDFLVQELNREVNTMSSKSVDYGISRLAVDMKTEIEKVREQVQNLQ